MNPMTNYDKQHQPSSGAANAVVPQEIHYKSQYIIISPGQPTLFPVTPGPIIMEDEGAQAIASTPPPILEAAYYPPTTAHPSLKQETTLPPQGIPPLPKRHIADVPQVIKQVE